MKDEELEGVYLKRVLREFSIDNWGDGGRGYWGGGFRSQMFCSSGA